MAALQKVLRTGSDSLEVNRKIGTVPDCPVRGTPMTGSSPPVGDNASRRAGYLVLAMLTRSNGASDVAPLPVLAAVGNQQGTWPLQPAQLGQFLRANASAHFVCDNAGGMHHILHHHLGRAGDTTAQQILWNLVADGRLLDTGLLDQLIRLAHAGSRRPPRLTLQQLAQEYASIPLRSQFDLQQLITPVSPAQAHNYPELATELSHRVRAIVAVSYVLWRQADAAGLSLFDPVVAGQRRIPALALQVKADVALAHVRPNGLRPAPGAIYRIVQACESARDRSAAQLLADREASQWLKTEPSGRVKFKPNGSPEIRRNKLNRWLARLAERLQGLHQTEIIPPRDNDQPSEAPEQWREFAWV